MWPDLLEMLREEDFIVAALMLGADWERAVARRHRGGRPGRDDPHARGVYSLNVAAASAVAFWATRVS